MKKILFLLLLTVASYGQTYQNPTFGTVKTMTAPTVTTTPHLGTVEANGVISKITPANLPVSTATQTAIDAKVGDFINDGATTIAPSMNAVYDALQLKKNATSTAITSTLTITNNTTSITVSAFTGKIVDNSTVPATITNISFSGAVNVVPLYFRTILYVDNTGTLQQFNGASSDLSPLQRVDNLFVGIVVFSGGTVQVIQTTPDVEYATDNRLTILGSYLKNINDGNNIGANGANLQVNKGAGTTWRLGSNFATDRKVPDVTTDIAATPIPAGVNLIGYRNGSGGWTYEAYTGSITPGFWDNGSGTKQTVSNNKYTNHRVYFFNGTNTYVIYLGRTEFSTLDVAETDAKLPPAIVDPATSVASLIGTISVAWNATALNNTSQARFTQGPRMQGGVGGGGVSGSQTMQNTYLNSAIPQITTTAALGAVTIRRGSAADTDNILVGQNGAGTNTFSVTGAGVLNASNKQNSLATDGTGVKFPTVDAVNSEKTIKTVVYEGDSITDTSGAGYPTNYPNQISDYNFDFSRAGQVNVAQAGDQIQAFIAGGQYASQVQPYKPTNNKERVLFCLMMGTNDFAVGRTPAQVYADLKTVWAQAKADKFTVVAFTVTRSTNATRDAGSVAVAELIASDPTLYDYLIRTDLILPNPSDTFYFNGDGIHLTEEGSIKIAQELNRVVSSQINGYDYLETSLPIINGNVSIGKSKAVKFSKLDIKGFAAPAMPANSGINQSSGIISRFGDSGNLVLDLGGASASGAWLQSTDALNLSTNYPLLLNPNGGDVKIKSALVESNNKDALVVSDTRTQSTGVGGSILFKGVYTDGGSPIEFGRISLMKENSTNANYSFGLGLYASANGGTNPSASPDFYVSGGGFISASNYTGSATLTGTPTAPTATAGTNTTQIATTAFVQNAVSGGTFTPTLTNVSNIASVSLLNATYTKTGDIVTATIGYTVTYTSNSVASNLRITLPVARSISSVVNIGSGSVSSSGTSYTSSVVQTDSNTTEAIVYSVANGTTSSNGVVTFQYSLN